jgi:hypothetical protein
VTIEEVSLEILPEANGANGPGTFRQYYFEFGIVNNRAR